MPTSDPKLVLHVEDDPQVRESIALLLRSAGLEVVSAGDGDEALEAIISHDLRPDLLIVDFMLPGDMDGADVAQAICSTLRRVLPVIILSAHLSSASLPWLPGAPFLCLWKPADGDVLLRSVDTFISLGRFLAAHRATAL